MNEVNTKFIITGNSMFPLLKHGDSVFVNKTNVVKKNDIICFFSLSGKLPVIHRVVYISDKFVLTCGDNNIFPDSIISRKNVFGIADIKNLKKEKQSENRFSVLMAFSKRIMQKLFSVIIINGWRLKLLIKRQ